MSSIGSAWFSILLAASILLGLTPTQSFADQVGIDKVRLIEEQPGTYVLEVDAQPRFSAAYSKPVPPPRFEVLPVERTRLPGYLRLRYRLQTDGAPLGVDDELLLPWGRAGVALVVRWHDGTVHQGLFLREFDGIRIPISQVKTVERSQLDISWALFSGGFRDACAHFPFWLLALSLVLFTSRRGRFVLLFTFAAGQSLALVAVEVGALVVPTNAVDLCTLVLVVLLVRRGAYDVEVYQRFSFPLMILGLLTGLAIARDFDEQALEVDVVSALFLTNLGIQSFLLILALGLGEISTAFGSRTPKWLIESLRYALGGCAVAGLVSGCLSLGDHQSGESPKDQNTQAEFALAASPGLGGSVQPQRNGTATRPLATFVSVDPTEVRVEVLLRLSDARDWGEVSANRETIQVADQPSFKSRFLEMIEGHVAVQVDGETVPAQNRRADFVVVGANGVLNRESPIDESISDAVLGVTFVYPTSSMPMEVELSWSWFPEALEGLEVTTIDPFGREMTTLTPDHRRMDWRNRWPGYRVPEIETVNVPKIRIPVVSIVTLGLIGILLMPRKRIPRKVRTLMLVVAVCFATVAYPYIRVAVAAPLSPVWKPGDSEMRTLMQQMLFNVYRSYDAREEEEIYDRLALTITGAQLTDVYLEMRNSLELENRGGARAKVDDVAIHELELVKATDGQGLAVDVLWTVSGSVTHFGHTHYRRNRYRAEVQVVPIDGKWMIRSIDVGEQEREL